MILFFLFIGFSWLAGSFPSAYIAARMLDGTDIRTRGSGNPGATNVYRLYGLKAAIPVFAADFLKGFLPVWCALNLGLDFPFSAELVAILAGVAAFLGHLYPVFTGFRGGKGVATGAGILTALYPPLFPLCLAIFVFVFLVSHKVSLASMLTSLSVPVWYFLGVYFFHTPISLYLALLVILLPAAVIFRHRKNIAKLLRGEEKKLF